MPLLALAACEKEHPSYGQLAEDGYHLEDVSDLRNPVIRVMIHISRADMLKAYPGVPPEDLQAFTTYNKERTTCTVHLVDPAKKYKPQWAGHELLHCVYGNWHPSQGHSASPVSVRKSSKAQVR